MMRALYVWEHGEGLEVYVDNPPEAIAIAAIEQHVRRIFRLDDDLSQIPHGRIVCSATPFEDLVKLLCASLLEWKDLVWVVDYLVNTVGHGIFPAPAILASVNFDFLEPIAGPRTLGANLRRVAKAVVCGELDCAHFTSEFSVFSDEEVVDKLHTVRGLSAGFVSHAMILFGRYGSIVSADGTLSDARTSPQYHRYGNVAGLAAWISQRQSDNFVRSISAKGDVHA